MKPALGGGQDTVKEDFDRDVNSFGGEIARILNKITSGCPMDSMWFWLFRTISAHHLNVHCFAIFWGFVKQNEQNGSVPVSM